MKVLCLSDKIIPFIYSPAARQRFADIDLILGCGDLPYYYLEYILSVLDVPLFYVRGNHDLSLEISPDAFERSSPHGAIDLHGRTARYQGLLIAGVEGCLRYRPGSFQYSQQEMWWHVLRLAPRLLLNRILYGRYLDVFLTHAPPSGIHDATDLPHQGITAFRWLITAFRPAYHIHGHVHVYRPDAVVETRLGSTCVINAFGFREVEI